MNYSRSTSLIALLLIVATALGALAAEKPNIIWITVEDMSCDFGYQGETLVDTPNVDRLAKEGVVFSNAYVTAGAEDVADFGSFMPPAGHGTSKTKFNIIRVGDNRHNFGGGVRLVAHYFPFGYKVWIEEG